MAFISYVPYEEATPLLRQLYERCHNVNWGGVDNIIRIHGHDPWSMERHHELYHHLVQGPSPLSRQQREMVAVVVSGLNRCHYSVRHHGAALRALTNRREWIRQLANDWRSADLSQADRALLEYVEKVTLQSWSVTPADVENLRAAGFADAAILDACRVASYLGFVNRLANGLGLELEPFWEREDFDPASDWAEQAGSGGSK